MEFKFHCPHCDRRLAADEKLIGRTVQCPDCDGAIQVPAPASRVQPTFTASTSSAPEPKTSPKRETKACPYCAEEILAKAKKCKHCGEMLYASRKTQQQEQPAPVPTPAPRQNPVLQTTASAGNLMVEDRKSRLTLAALLLGIGGIFTYGLTAVPAVICGHLAVRRSRVGGRAIEIKTIVGMILGYLVIGVWVLAILAGLVLPDSKPVDRDHKEQVQAKPGAERRQRLQRRELAKKNFLSSIEEHYRELRALVEKKKGADIMRKVGEFETYGQLEFKDVNEIRAPYRRQQLIQEYKALEPGDYRGELLIFEELLSLFPGNKKYQEKTQVLRAKAVEIERRENEARAEIERRENEARAEVERKKKIKDQFSKWDGSHIALSIWIKAWMNDPDSYKHVKTTYWDNGDHLIVRTEFRGKNGFGGVVKNSWKAKVDLNGNVIEIIEKVP